MTSLFLKTLILSFSSLGFFYGLRMIFPIPGITPLNINKLKVLFFRDFVPGDLLNSVIHHVYLPSIDPSVDVRHMVENGIKIKK